MFFNIELCQRNMSPKDLMAVRPEVLAKLILHKREMLAKKLPQTVAEISEEKETAEQLARASRSNKETLGGKITNLKSERKGVNATLEEILKNEEMDDSSKSRPTLLALVSTLGNDDLACDDFREALSKLDSATLDFINSGKNETLKETLAKQIITSNKANDALEILLVDYSSTLDKWNENESHRRRIESKYAKLSSSLKDSNLAIEFWQNKIENGFEDLLEDAKRVADGGPSSRQINRSQRSKTKSGRI